MNNDLESVKESWAVLESVLTPPADDEALDRLIGFTDSILAETGGDESHPLHGLFLQVCDAIEKYEKTRFPEPEVDPVDRLKYLMEDRGLRQKDLVDIGIGNRSTVSNLLAGRRSLSMRQIGILSEYFECSPAVFFPSSVAAGGSRQ
jgi:HTH-type transcriptional regulator/antitoxin HigA